MFATAFSILFFLFAIVCYGISFVSKRPAPFVIAILATVIASVIWPSPVVVPMHPPARVIADTGPTPYVPDTAPAPDAAPVPDARTTYRFVTSLSPQYYGHIVVSFSPLITPAGCDNTLRWIQTMSAPNVPTLVCADSGIPLKP